MGYAESSPDLFGAQMPRLWTVPARHNTEVPSCRECARKDEGYSGIGCGDYLATEIIDWARGIGYVLDPWQEWVIREGCGTRPDGRWASFENTLIISRQNGKSAILEIRELAGMYLLGEGLVIHTAHEVKTSQEQFLRVSNAVLQNPALSKRLKGKPRASHGEEAIELRPTPTLIFGSGNKWVHKSVAPRLRFLARSRASIRGFSADCLVWDEAMILSSEAVGAALPALSAQSNPQIWLAGSAGLEDSEQLARSRRRILRDTKDMFGAEWSVRHHLPTCPVDRENGRPSNNFVVCDEHDDRDTAESAAKANPAFGYRLTWEQTFNELTTMPVLEYDRERLGVGQWPAEDEAWRVVSEDLFRSLAVDVGKARPEPRQCAFAVDIDEKGTGSTISVAWMHPDGYMVMEVPKNCSRTGTNWVMDRLTELTGKYKPLAVVVPSTGPAAGIGDDLEKAWPKHPKFNTILIRPGPQDQAAAFAWFVQQCKDENQPLRHLGEKKGYALWHAVGVADTRTVGDGGETWSVRDSVADITAARSANLAAWGLNKKKRNYDLLASVR